MIIRYKVDIGSIAACVRVGSRISAFFPYNEEIRLL
jgi:hypothetical protein